jgi:hypothetical protein
MSKPTIEKTKPAQPKTKAQRTFKDDVDQLAKSREIALTAVLSLFSSATKSDAEFKTADSKLNSYIQRKRTFAIQWTADGTRRENIERARKLVYFVRTRIESERFVGEIFRRTDDGETILLTLSGHETAKAAKQACYEWAAAESVEVIRSYRRFYEGELTYETEMEKLAAMRMVATEANHKLVMLGRKKGVTAEEFESTVFEAWISISRYLMRQMLCKSQWTADGKWTGPKKKVKKTVDPIDGEIRSDV